VSAPVYSVAKLAPELDLAAFDCGVPAYNVWLIDHAATSVQAGVCAVYVLIESDGPASRVVGYYAISPTQVVRDEAPQRMARGWPRSIPAWRLGKLAVHVDLRADEVAQWGRQLLRHALETIVAAADVGGGKVVVVDADNAGLLEFYLRNGFTPTGRPGDLTLFVTVATVRKALSAPQ
jgi:ribosomal protein S18 acetylase RimI-like enzyme